MSTKSLVTIKILLAAFSILCFTQSTQAAAIAWRTNLDAAKIEAGRTGKPLLLHFYTPSCGPCKLLEQDVFSQPQIAATMEQNFVPVKINADVNPALAKAYGITSVPLEILLTSNGKPIQKLGCPKDANSYGAQLVNAANHFRQQTTSPSRAPQAPMHSAYAGLNINQARNIQPVAATQPVAAAKPPTASQPIMPVTTTNPYLSAAPTPRPTTVAQAPVQKQVRQQPKVPANAMPNSYRNPYATLQTPTATVAPTTPTVVKTTPAANVAVTPQITTPAPTTPATSKPTVRQVAATAPIAAKAWPPEMPAGTPDLAFDGCCPVSLKESKKWIHGNQEFGAIHRDQTFLFASKRHQQQFLASPDAYSPVFSGNDPVKMLDENMKVAGKRKFGCEQRGAFYLFSCKETMERFISQPDKYSAAVRQAMARMDAANGTLRR